ncbi:MAG TPA: efflux RND transporter periplasmic adaptor subunit [Acetobacteraceae bacterium]|nr:efflux RND transporter periplasmic adaptor subunit [Acetobacteraceae bacterium]
MAQKRFRLPLFAAIVVAAGLGSWLLLSHHAVHATLAADPADDAPPAVPVTAAPARLADVPVYLRGLGTVEAFNIVEIRAQVNGTLIALPVGQGEEVRKGQIVAEIDPRPYKATLDQATAQRAEDAAQLHSAALDLARYQSLQSRSFASVQQVDDQQATVDRLRAAIQADDAAVESALINLGFCTIRAPIAGRVGFYQTDVGNLIEASAQTGILSITEDKPISVVFTLPEADLPRIQAAMAKGTLPVAAYTADEATKLATGTLLTPDNTIDTTTGTIQLKATFANANDRLWPGEFVNAWLLLNTLRNVVTVPVPAVQHGPDGLFVYIVKPDHTVATQPVTLGEQDGNLAVVAGGLQAGQQVVLAGQSRLMPGVRVTATAPDNEPGGAGGAIAARDLAHAPGRD